MVGRNPLEGVNIVEHRFLLAADSASARHMVRQILASRHGWLVCGEASDGDSAVEKALGSSPDIVILDISMPPLNGIEAARHILKACPQTPVLMISAFHPTPYLAYLFELGICGFVPKDAVQTDLVPAIEALLQGKRYLRPAHHWLALADAALRETLNLAPPQKPGCGASVSALTR